MRTTPPLVTPTPPSQLPQKWRWPTTPSKARVTAGSGDALDHPRLTFHALPLPPLPQVLLFLQEEKEEIAAETQVILVVALRASRCSPWGSWSAAAHSQDSEGGSEPPAPTRITPFT